MIAVVKIAGQQFKVSQGQVIYVPHLQHEDKQINLTEILLIDNDGKLELNPTHRTIIAEVIQPCIKSEKVIAFKMKRRKGFRKKHGHRTSFTKLLIKEIN